MIIFRNNNTGGKDHELYLQCLIPYSLYEKKKNVKTNCCHLASSSDNVNSLFRNA